MPIKRIFLRVDGDYLTALDPDTGEFADSLELGPTDELEWSISSGFSISEIWCQEAIPATGQSLPPMRKLELTPIDPDRVLSSPLPTPGTTLFKNFNYEINIAPNGAPSQSKKPPKTPPKTPPRIKGMRVRTSKGNTDPVN